MLRRVVLLLAAFFLLVACTPALFRIVPADVTFQQLEELIFSPTPSPLPPTDNEPPSDDDPLTDEPIVDDPVVDEPVSDDPVVDDRVTDVPEPECWVRVLPEASAVERIIKCPKSGAVVEKRR
jgi:hypothetical protein